MATTTVTKVIEIDVKASANAQAQIKQMADNLESLDSTSKKSQNSMEKFFGSITSGLKGLAVGFVITELTSGLIGAVAAVRDMADSTQVMRSRLEQVMGSSQAAGKAFAEITRISVAQGASFTSIGTLYEKIARQQEALGITTSGVSKITEGFAASLRLSGSGAQQADAAILQFSQALASGRLQGDEFRSIMENNSVFMIELAKSAGVTQGALRKMSSEGKVDAEFLREAMFKMGADGSSMLERLTANAAKLPMTFKQAREGVVTELGNLIDALFNTANKSEGIFTRMAKNVADMLGVAARAVREDAEIKAAQAGEASPMLQAGALTRNQQRDEDLESRAARAITTQGKLRIELAKNNDMSRKMNDEMRKSSAMALQQDLETSEREIAAIRRIQKERQDAAKENGPGSNPLQSGWKPTAADPKKGGGSKSRAKSEGEQDAEDLDDLLNDLRKAEREVEAAANDVGKNSMRVLELIAKTSLDTSRDEFGKYKNGILQAAAETAAALDEQLASNKRLEAYNEEVGKKYKANLALVDQGYKKWQKVDQKGKSSEEIYSEAIVELQELINAADAVGKLDISSDLESQLIHLQVGFEKTGKKAKSVADEITEAMTNSTKEMADAIVDFASGTEASFGKMLINIAKKLASAELQKLLNPLMKETGNWLSGLLGGAAGGGLGGLSADTVYGAGSGWGMSALGNVFGPSGQIDYFAKGGVVGSPTLFGHAGGMGMMGEAGEEAIMPLSRDASGKLGVGAAPVTIEINNYSGAQVTQSTSTDDNGSQKITLMIEKAVENGIATGKFDKTMRGTYGLKRQGR